LGHIYDYDCGEIISEGTFGLVYTAYKGGKKYAIKKLKLTDQDKESAVYKREINTLKKMEHENVRYQDGKLIAQFEGWSTKDC